MQVFSQNVKLNLKNLNLQLVRCISFHVAREDFINWTFTTFGQRDTLRPKASLRKERQHTTTQALLISRGRYFCFVRGRCRGPTYRRNLFVCSLNSVPFFLPLFQPFDDVSLLALISANHPHTHTHTHTHTYTRISRC